MALLVLHLRAARGKARAAAVAEALALLHDLAPPPRRAGRCRSGAWPGSSLPERHLAAATARLPRLGYSTAVDLVAPARDARPHLAAPPLAAGAAPHRGRRRPPGGAPDRREFLFPAAAAGPAGARLPRRPGPLARRGLPVCDARLLVNLVAPAGPGLLLDLRRGRRGRPGGQGGRLGDRHRRPRPGPAPRAGPPRRRPPGRRRPPPALRAGVPTRWPPSRPMTAGPGRWPTRSWPSCTAAAPPRRRCWRRLARGRAARHGAGLGLRVALDCPWTARAPRWWRQAWRGWP